MLRTTFRQQYRQAWKCRYYTTQDDIHRIPPQLNLSHYAKHVESIANSMRLRNYEPDCVYEVKRLSDEKIELEKRAALFRDRRDEINQSIRSASSKQERNEFIHQAKHWKDQLRQVEEKLVQVESDLINQALLIPNDIHPDAPRGPETNATMVKTVGSPRTERHLRDHLTLAESLDMVDFEQAAVVTGSKFYYLKNAGAWLECALIQYALHKAAARGFMPVLAPDIVRTSIAYGCGFQPRKKEASQIYDVSTASMAHTTAPKLCLAGTAEIPLAGMFAQKMLKEEELPKRVVGFSHSFRAEAGHGSAEERGLYRRIILHKLFIPEMHDPRPSQTSLDSLNICLLTALTQLSTVKTCNMVDVSRCAFDRDELWRAAEIVSVAMDIYHTCASPDDQAKILRGIKMEDFHHGLIKSFDILRNTREFQFNSKNWLQVADWMQVEIRRHQLNTYRPATIEDTTAMKKPDFFLAHLKPHATLSPTLSHKQPPKSLKQPRRSISFQNQFTVSPQHSRNTSISSV
ncbi:Putative Seryl-tRNA synthetase [Rhizopus microsporus]|nr:Putative Seryl-tRNA synthetase [Rhizopus microsporus]